MVNKAGMVLAIIWGTVFNKMDFRLLFLFPEYLYKGQWFGKVSDIAKKM